MVLSALGVFDSLQHTVVVDHFQPEIPGRRTSRHWFSASLILGYTVMLGALNIVLITAMSTVGSVIYNLMPRPSAASRSLSRETD